MNNWWSELEIMKRNVAEQQEQLQLAYIKIKELSDILNKERNDFGYIVDKTHVQHSICFV